MAYSLGSITSLGVIQEESFILKGELTAFPVYGGDRTETDIDDFGGAVLTITPLFEKIDTKTNILTYIINELMPLIQGAQDANHGYPIDYVSDYFATLKVKVLEISGTIVAGEPTRLNYSIKLIQSRAV